MTTDSDAAPSAPAGLKSGAIGIVAVIFMAVANAAPITAMTGNTPIAVGFGNGLGAPAGFLFATIILTLFALGYAANSLVFKAGPYLILAVFVIGVVYALRLRSPRPDVYAEVGRTVMEDAHERAETG